MQMKPSTSVKIDRILIIAIPLVIAIAILFAVIIVGGQRMPAENVGLNLCNMMITVWATCLGFMITSISILLTVAQNKHIEMLKQTGHFKTILFSFMSCCVHILIALVFLIVITFMQKWCVMAFGILCATTAGVLLNILCCLYFLSVIIAKS